MRAVTRILLVAALAFGAGCAQKDWIDRTLVTVDVTGTWSGTSAEGGAYSGASIAFELEQQGPTVKGLLRYRGITTSVGDLSGPMEGTVGGDVFRFRNRRGSAEGEVIVNGDEMLGRISTSVGRYSISLRRVDPSSPPASPPR
jgi:hypothetical protein